MHHWKRHFSRALLFPEPMGSMSSMEVNIDVLEQMDLMDISDQEALDVFLNSGGEDNAVLSPVSGGRDHRAQMVTLTHPLPPEGNPRRTVIRPCQSLSAPCGACRVPSLPLLPVFGAPSGAVPLHRGSEGRWSRAVWPGQEMGAPCGHVCPTHCCPQTASHGRSDDFPRPRPCPQAQGDSPSGRGGVCLHLGAGKPRPVLPAADCGLRLGPPYHRAPFLPHPLLLPQTSAQGSALPLPVVPGAPRPVPNGTLCTAGGLAPFPGTRPSVRALVSFN